MLFHVLQYLISLTPSDTSKLQTLALIVTSHLKMTDFEDIMSTRSNNELLEITNLYRDDYQPEAIVAAEAELNNRNLTEEQLAAIKTQLSNKQREKERKNEKLKIFKNKTANFVDTINPLTEKTIDKQTKMVTIGLTISFLFFFIKNWSLTILMIRNIGNADISSLVYFAPLILFTIGLIGFWKSKKYGWVIVSILLTSLTITTLITMGLEIKWVMRAPIQFENGGYIQMHEVENSALKELFDKKGFAFYIGQLILSSGLLIFLNRKKITEKYLINRRTQLLVIGLTATPFILFGMTIII